MKTKEELESLNNKACELTDEDLKDINGGVNWQKFGKNILSYGGGSCPELAELVANILAQNWPMVAIQAKTAAIAANPIIIKALNES